MPGGSPFSENVPVGGRHGVERVVEHADPRVHPAVHVALEGDHDFLRAEGVRHLHPLNRLALVEFLVRLRQAVDVVQRVVAVDDLQRLPDLDAEDMGRVVTALLIRATTGAEGAGNVWLPRPSFT